MGKLKYAIAAAAVFASLLCVSCQKETSEVLDPKSPAVITLWHSYNAVAKEELDHMVQTFNETVGMEKGIIVNTEGYGSSEELEQALYASVNHMIGADPLPDIFASYPDNAFRLDQIMPLVNLDKYFTEEELGRYREEFLEEGVWDESGSHKMIPVAKSTELLYLNKTDWERFAGETGARKPDLRTWEGLVKTAEMYYEWSGGEPFLGMNSYSAYAVLTAAQLGEGPYDRKAGESFAYSKETARKAWDAYYVPHIRGWFKSSVYNQDGVKSGKMIAYIGSSAGAAFFPSRVIEDENRSHAIECECLPYPTFEGGVSYMAQRGANMAVFPGDPAHEYASAEFLKWFTEPEQNVEFAVSTGYLPVENDALKAVAEQLSDVNEESNTQAVRNSMLAALEAMNENLFYIRRPFDGSYQIEAVFDSSLEEKTEADLSGLKKRVKEGEDRETIVNGLLGSKNFDKWYECLMKEMAGISNE